MKKAIVAQQNKNTLKSDQILTSNFEEVYRFLGFVSGTSF